LLTDYAYIGLFLLVAIALAAVMVLLPLVLRLIRLTPHKPNAVKNSTFECGMETIGKTLVRFNFRYYFYALLFITFDILVLFVYPWAVGLRQLGWAGFIAILVFILLIVIAYIYAWKKKVLEWK
jgi:NADH-quinone oxidoreductase subunit A